MCGTCVYVRDCVQCCVRMIVLLLFWYFHALKIYSQIQEFIKEYDSLKSVKKLRSRKAIVLANQLISSCHIHNTMTKHHSIILYSTSRDETKGRLKGIRTTPNPEKPKIIWYIFKKNLSFTMSRPPYIAHKNIIVKGIANIQP